MHKMQKLLLILNNKFPLIEWFFILCYNISMYTQTSTIASLVTTTLAIDPYIKSVSKFIDKYVGYKLGFDNVNGTAKDLYFDGTGTTSLIMNMYILKETTPHDVEMNDVAISPKEYPLNEDYCSYLVNSGGFAIGDGNIKVKDARVGRYVVDWTDVQAHTLPEDITMACNALVVGSIKKDMGKTSGVVSSETIGEYSVSYSTSIGDVEVAKALSILDNYKKINFA